MHQDIVTTLKEHYSRDLRKGIVKSMLKYEKTSDEESKEASYKVINQIFSYVISQLNWNLAESTSSWNDLPLLVISETFPKIDTTKWFKERQLQVSKSIDLKS
jgi:hypothetical protein